jgi:hypothetical protein
MSAITFRPEFAIGYGRTDRSLSWSPPFHINAFDAALLSLGFGHHMLSQISDVRRCGGELDFGPYGDQIEFRYREILKAMEKGHLSVYDRNISPVHMRHTSVGDLKTWANIHQWALPEWMRTGEFAGVERIEGRAADACPSFLGTEAVISAKNDGNVASQEPIKMGVPPVETLVQFTQGSDGHASEPKDSAVHLESASISSAVLQKSTSNPRNLDRHTARRTKEELIAFVDDPKNQITLGANRKRTAAEIARAFRRYIVSSEYSGSLVDRPPTWRRIENLLSELKQEGHWKPLSPSREHED